MTRFALSTMFAQQSRFEDGGEFARFAAEAGYDALEISHSTSYEKLRQVVASAVLPIAAVHQPAPFEDSFLGVPNTALNLASLDAGERDEALHFARRSIDVAVEVGAAAVVLHLGHIDDTSLAAMDARLRGGSATNAFVPGALRRTAIEQRTRLAEPYLAAARDALRHLVSHAAATGVVLGIESRINFHELPLAAELPYLLDGFDPALVGYWHDVGHVEVLHRLGYVRRDAWFTQPGVRVVGAHVHDVAGIRDHRAPGHGDVAWQDHLAYLDHLDTWTLEIDQHEPDAAVAAAPRRLAELPTRSGVRG